MPLNIITHKKITELIPKQFRFGTSSTQITEYNSHSNSVKGFGNPVLTLLTETQVIPETNRFGNHRAGITENNSKIIKFGSVIFLCVVVLWQIEPKLAFEGFVVRERGSSKPLQ